MEGVEVFHSRAYALARKGPRRAPTSSQASSENGLPARVALARLLIDPQQERSKHLPVNGATEPLQRVAATTQLTVTVFKVKEAALHAME